MTSECPPILAPETQNCSGRGVCIDSAHCFCEPGWTGAGDFVFGAPSCAVNILAISILWSLAAVLEFACIILTINFYRRKKKLVKAITKSQTMFVASCFVHNGAWAICGILRVSRSELKTIGAEPVVTTIYVLGMLALTFAVDSYIYIFLEMAIHQSKMNPNMNVPRMKLYVVMVNVIILVTVWFPEFMLAASDSQTARHIISAHNYLMALGFLILLFMVIPSVIGSFVRDIKLALKNNQKRTGSSILAPVAKKMILLERIANGLCIHQIIVTTTIGTWQFLLVEGSPYWVPILAIPSATIQIAIIINLTPPRKPGQESQSGVSSVPV